MNIKLVLSKVVLIFEQTEFRSAGQTSLSYSNRGVLVLQQYFACTQQVITNANT